MNKLTEFLVNSILEIEIPGKAALFGGGFKPPTKGHLEVVLQGLKQNPEVDEVYIFVGSGVRNNISQEESIKIWEMYKTLIPVKTTIVKSGSPLNDTRKFYADMEGEKPLIFIGSREGDEGDEADFEERSKYYAKYDITPTKITTSDFQVSGTKARNAALNDDRKELNTYLPDALSDSQKEEIYDMLRSVVKENVPNVEDDGKAAPFGSGYKTLKELEDEEIGFWAKHADIFNILRKTPSKYKELAQKLSGERKIALNYFWDNYFENGEALLNENLGIETKPKMSFEERLAYYKDYYINVSPSTFDIITEDGTIVIGGLDKPYPKDFNDVDDTIQVPVPINENASYSKDIDIKNKIDQLTQHMIDKGYNIEPLPALKFVDGDTENARDFFGKTAYYNPNSQTIVLYTEGRHPKDIVRSYAHEMIHHIQNLEGRLGNITTTNTQEDDELNKIEAEANLKGTMTFRNWTDSLNEIGDASATKLEWNPAQIEKIAKEIERKIANQADDTVEYYDMLPAIEVISYESRTRYRVTVDASVDKPEDELAMTTLRVDFTTEEGGDDAINKGEQYKILATLTDIIIQLITRVNEIDSTTLDLVKFYAKDDTEGRYANPDSKRGKLYQAFINKNLSNLPGDWKMSTSDEVIMLSPVVSEGFNKKLGKDPFGLNQFARELMAEGAYDSLTTKLTKATINKWVEDSKKKPMPKKSFVDIDIDDVDGKGREIEFNYVGMVEFDKKVDGYEVDGTSNSGEDEGKIPFVATLFRINPKVLPQAWSKISADVSDVIRHEIEHLTQAGDNVRGQQYDEKGNLVDKGKYMEDDIILRDLINKAKVLPQSDYYKLEKEVDAMLQGLYLKAKKTKKPFKDVIKNYLDVAPGIETKEDRKVILNLWRSRRGALSLPVFETEKQVMKEGMEDLYTIYLDMDGVIVDFDRQFEEAFDMPPREFEEAFGTEMFWKKIEERGVGFWRGMKWMPGGQELYNRVAQHDHYLLSSPSKSDTSKIGKHMWKKDKTPNTKLILSRSYNKKNYADKSNILIDDRESNIQQWRDAGGIGILYKSAEQVNKELDKLGL